MLQVARLAPKLLGESTPLVIDFVRSQFHPDGGFRDRAGESDLYYTVFGLEALLALRADISFDVVARFLGQYGDGEGLDLVHLACLARCWADLPESLRVDVPQGRILDRIESHRSGDGGYHAVRGSSSGTIYACFLATGAYQDLDRPMPDAGAMLGCIQPLRASDGGYANQVDLPIGTTPTTAAAAILLRWLDQPMEAGISEWLLACCHKDGGFFASPMTPLPDLLSTATALHALSCMQADIGAIKEPTLNFIDSLWTNKGGFYGNWSDDALDCEYTYYALLALGHLSL